MLLSLIFFLPSLFGEYLAVSSSRGFLNFISSDSFNKHWLCSIFVEIARISALRAYSIDILRLSGAFPKTYRPSL